MLLSVLKTTIGKVFFLTSQIVKWGAPSRWSFHPDSAWGIIETTTIGKTRPTL